MCHAVHGQHGEECASGCCKLDQLEKRTGKQIRLLATATTLLVFALGSSLAISHYQIHTLLKDHDSLRSELTKIKSDVQELKTLGQITKNPPPIYIKSDDAIFGVQDLKSNKKIVLSRPKRAIPALYGSQDSNATNLNKTTEIYHGLNVNGSFTNASIQEPQLQNWTIATAEKEFKMNSGKGQRKNNKNARIVRLKEKLYNCRRRCRTLRLDLAKQGSVTRAPGSRATYIIPIAPYIDVTGQGQHIGPWYIPQTGDNYGFTDMWYDGLSLDQERTSIVFTETALYLIYSQIYYHIFPDLNEESPPMGYKICLQKSNAPRENQTEPASSRNYRRPIVLAECMTSYPTTIYQTCGTQVSWLLEAGDKIYLEHSTQALPMIEADSPGKTFIQITKFN